MSCRQLRRHTVHNITLVLVLQGCGLDEIVWKSVVWITDLSVTSLAKSFHVVDLDNSLGTGDAERSGLIHGTYLIDIAFTLDAHNTIGSHILLNLLSAPNLDDSIVLTRCEEHILVLCNFLPVHSLLSIVICNGDASNRMVVFMESIDKSTLRSKLVKGGIGVS